MKTEPSLPKQHLQEKISQHYGLNLKTLDFLPIGEGSWCYRGIGDHEVFIQLIKDKIAGEKTTDLQQFLTDNEIPVLIPLMDRSERSVVDIGNFGLILYPYIVGSSLMESKNSDHQNASLRKEIGSTVAHLHTLAKGNENSPFNLPKEDFTNFQTECQLIVYPDQYLSSYSQNNNMLVNELTNFIKARQPELRNLIEVTTRLGYDLRRRELSYVLCHGDIHEDNILLADSGRKYIIDWDNAILAPKERDLFFFGENNDYLTGYFGNLDETRPISPLSVDPYVIDYYVLEWALQEIYDYGSRILFDMKFDQEGRLDAWQQFQLLFDNNRDVDLALRLARNI